MRVMDAYGIAQGYLIFCVICGEKVAPEADNLLLKCSQLAQVKTHSSLAFYCRHGRQQIPRCGTSIHRENSSPNVTLVLSLKLRHGNIETDT